jgi:DNA repair protein RecO
MAYKTYTTEALVISIRNRIGADRSIQLFTEESGMLSARAAGIREEKSKMRYALQPFSFARVTLVRGRHEWRLTGALCDSNVFFAAQDRACRVQLLKLMRLVDRFITGEEESRDLFRIVKEGIHHLAEFDDEHAYRVVAFRVLSLLGYIAPKGELEALVSPLTLSEILLGYDTSLGAHLDRDIERALSVSHL